MRLFKDQFGEDEFDLTVDKAAERTGRRIRTIRMARGLSQGELGAKVGLTADRIQKYENGARKPKLDLLRQIALALDVSVYALMDPTTSSYVNSMYTLFEMEKDYGLELDKIDGKVCITFDRHAGLYSHIEEWYLFYRLTQEKLQSAISTEEKS
jgi:transcriptional regulator with XRE-family HTH domain